MPTAFVDLGGQTFIEHALALDLMPADAVLGVQ
jgi:hypothetical protein